ncbi:hypothetical protein AAY473_002172, partial [Plecturocebus cupreus]
MAQEVLCPRVFTWKLLLLALGSKPAFSSIPGKYSCSEALHSQPLLQRLSEHSSFPALVPTPAETTLAFSSSPIPLSQVWLQATLPTPGLHMLVGPCDSRLLNVLRTREAVGLLERSKSLTLLPVEKGFHQVDQAGLELLTSANGKCYEQHHALENARDADDPGNPPTGQEIPARPKNRCTVTIKPQFRQQPIGAELSKQ